MPPSSLQVALPRKARIEIIPLIDVVFFLLATFVLFTLALEKIVVLVPQLPVPGRPLPGEDSTAYIQATEQGMYYWKVGRLSNPELISTAELTVHLEGYAKGVPAARVFICSDDKVKYGSAVMLIDLVKKAKIQQIAIETAPKSSVF